MKSCFDDDKVGVKAKWLLSLSEHAEPQPTETDQQCRIRLLLTPHGPYDSKNVQAGSQQQQPNWCSKCEFPAVRNT